jgi:hypothetical protein
MFAQVIYIDLEEDKGKKRPDYSRCEPLTANELINCHFQTRCFQRMVSHL